MRSGTAHQDLGERHEILDLRSGERRGGVGSPAGRSRHPGRIEPQRRRDSKDQAPSSEPHGAEGWTVLIAGAQTTASRSKAGRSAIVSKPNGSSSVTTALGPARNGGAS